MACCELSAALAALRSSALRSARCVDDSDLGDDKLRSYFHSGLFHLLVLIAFGFSTRCSLIFALGVHTVCRILLSLLDFFVGVLDLQLVHKVLIR